MCAVIATDPAPLCIVGDSHVSAFVRRNAIVETWPALVEGPIPRLTVCRVGAQLAGTLHRASRTGGRQKAFEVLGRLPAGAAVLFLFGEIDCRAHVVKRAGFREDRIPAAVAETVRNYLAFLTRARELAQDAGLGLVGVISPPPTATRPVPRMVAALSRGLPGRFTLKMVRELSPRRAGLRQSVDEVLNYVGSPQQRRMASRLFHEQLRHAVEEAGMAFVDGWTPFLRPDGWPDPACYWDGCHLRHEAALRLAPQFERIGLPHLSACPGEATGGRRERG